MSEATEATGALVLTERTAWGVRLILNRPAKLNAISRELREALDEALAAAVADDDVRVIVIAGAGRAFCAGYDLSEAAPDSAWGWREVLAEDAQLGEPEIRFGSAPVTLLMPYLIGQKATRELLFTGDLVGGREAHRMGLVNRAVPADRLAAEVDALADRLARVPPDVMAPTKLMLNRAMEAAGFLEAVAAGLDLQSFVNMSETSREFDAVVRREGLKAALAWRDQRYDERLAERGRAAAKDLAE